MSANDEISKLLHEYKSVLDSYYSAPDSKKVKLYEKLLNLSESIDPHADDEKEKTPEVSND